MLQFFALFTMLSAYVIGIAISSVLMAFITNSLSLTLLVVGAEIIGFFALLARIDIELNK